MIKSVILLKFRGRRSGPSARTLRRAIRPSRVKVGFRVVAFVILLSLVVGTIGISLNLMIETWEREHAAGLHRG